MTVAGHTAGPGFDASGTSPKVWWIGHSTVLIRMTDRWILTDPFLRERLGCVIKRFEPCGIEPSQLPNIDLILISHAHMDHLDYWSLWKIRRSAGALAKPQHMPWFPLPIKKQLSGRPWDSTDHMGMKITWVPVKHWGGRWFFDRVWRRSFTGYVLEYDGTTIFFAGDTGYAKEIFEQIGDRFDIDLAILPVGPAGGPFFYKWFTWRAHASPSQAMKIFKAVKARYMVPIHHGTFFWHGPSEIGAITDAIREHGVSENVFLLRSGEAFDMQTQRTSTR